MAAEFKMRIWGDLSGLGKYVSLPSSTTDSETPVHAAKTYMPVTTAPVQVDLANISPAQLRGMEIVCRGADVYVDAVSSANVTAACYISAEQAMHFMYEVGATAVPWVQSFTTGALIEALFYGVAT